MSRTENVSRNLIWGFWGKIITILLPFITRTVLVYSLGFLYAGLNSLFTSILQVLNVSELGISSAIIFCMYKPLAENDVNEVCALMNFYKLCYRVIGFVVLGLGLVLLPFLNLFVSGEVPQDINIYILYLMNLSATFISYELFAYQGALLMAAQRNDILCKVSSVTAIFQMLLQICVLSFFKNYYLYILAVICSGIVNNLCTAIISRKLFPYYKCEGRITKEKLKDISVKVGGMIFQKIGGVLLTSADSIIISKFLGLVTLGIYQNYYLIIVSLFGFLGVIMDALIATVGNSIVAEKVDKNFNDFRYLNFLYIWIVTWCSVCLLCLFEPFIQIWLGKRAMLPFEMVVLFVVYFYVHKWCDMLYVYQEACGLWWDTKMVPFTAAIVNLVVNIVLVKVIGLPGILISTIVSVLFIYDFGYAKILFTAYFKKSANLRKYIVHQFFYLFCAFIAASVTFAVCSLINMNLILQLLIRGAICCIVPNVILWKLWHKLPEYINAKKILEGVVKNRLRKGTY